LYMCYHRIKFFLRISPFYSISCRNSGCASFRAVVIGCKVHGVAATVSIFFGPSARMPAAHTEPRAGEQLRRRKPY